MVATTFNQELTQDPTFRVWVGISNKPANLFWSGNSLLIAIWKLLEAKGASIGLVRLEWS